jgi:hypothetical protein
VAMNVILPTARTAYRAAYAYMVCILVAFATLHPTWISSQIYRFRNKYQDIPDHISTTDSTLPHIHNPNHHHLTDSSSSSVAQVPPTPPSWTQTVWNRCNFIIKQRLAEIGWYQPHRNTRRWKSIRRDE